MKLHFLGDALDHWKYSVLSRLATANLVHELHVVPMFTDASQWDKRDLQAYCRLLGISEEVMTNRETLTQKNRRVYFQSVQSGVDLFLDPDTGVTTSRPSPKHLTTEDIHSLIMSTENEHRVLIIYQHSARGNFAARLRKISGFIKENVPTSYNCLYECGRVALLFVSRDKSRVRAIQAFLTTMMGPASENRVWGA